MDMNSRLAGSVGFCHSELMRTKMVELEPDAVEKLEAAKWNPRESYSEVVRRAQFPGKPRVAHELLEDFRQRAGNSPLSEEDLDLLAEAQRYPARAPFNRQTAGVVCNHTQC
jgi:hypothetical protein